MLLTNYADRDLNDRLALVAAADGAVGPPLVAAPGIIALQVSGDSFNGVPALMEVRVDGRSLGPTPVMWSASSNTMLVDAGGPIPDGARIDVAFVNDAWDPATRHDRNLRVESITVNGRTLKATDPGVILDLGSGDAAFDGQDTVPGQARLWVDGALRFTVPAATAQPSPDDAALKARKDILARFGRMVAFEVPAWEVLKPFVPAEGTVGNTWTDGVVDLPIRPSLSPVRSVAEVCGGGGSFAVDVDGVPVAPGQQVPEAAVATGSSAASNSMITLTTGRLKVRFDQCVDRGVTLDGTIESTYEYVRQRVNAGRRFFLDSKITVDQVLDVSVTLTGRPAARWHGGLKGVYRLGDSAISGGPDISSSHGQYHYDFKDLQRSSADGDAEVWSGAWMHDWQVVSGQDTVMTSNRSDNGGLSMTVAGTPYLLLGEWRQENVRPDGSARYPGTTLRVTANDAPVGTLGAAPSAGSGQTDPVEPWLFTGPMMMELDGSFYRQ